MILRSELVNSRRRARAILLRYMQQAPDRSPGFIAAAKECFDAFYALEKHEFSSDEVWEDLLKKATEASNRFLDIKEREETLKDER